jgi:hypothetical protein
MITNARKPTDPADVHAEEGLAVAESSVPEDS